MVTGKSSHELEGQIKDRLALSEDSLLGHGLLQQLVTTLQLEVKETMSIHTVHVQLHSYRH